MMDDQLFLSLVARKLSGEATSQELQEFGELLNNHPSYRQRYHELLSFWEKKAVPAQDLNETFQRVLEKARSSRDQQAALAVSDRGPSTTKIIYRRISIAAAILAFASITFYFLFTGRVEPQHKDLARKTWQVSQTNKGATAELTLDDGTRVTLNADSKLSFPTTFDSTIREVQLTGEAFFDVAHNAEKPFIIHAGKMNIRVLGTSFNVRAYPDDSTSEATLIRGMIEITVKDRPNNTFILRPTEKLVLVNHPPAEEKHPSAAATTSPATRLSIENMHYLSQNDSAVVETIWLQNKFVFKDESFANIAKGLERKYNVRILFQNEAVKKYRFTGVFEHENIAEVFKALSLTEPFNYQIKADTIIID